MKVWMEEKPVRKRNVIRFRAKIIKSKKYQIPATVQKTWKIYADDPMYDKDAIKKMFMANARRWQMKRMLEWFGSPEKFPFQMEIPNDKSEQKESVPDLLQAGLVPDREVAGPMHESAIDPTENNV